MAVLSLLETCTPPSGEDCLGNWAAKLQNANFHAKLPRWACGQKLGLSEEIVHVH